MVIATHLLAELSERRDRLRLHEIGDPCGDDGRVQLLRISETNVAAGLISDDEKFHAYAPPMGDFEAWGVL